MILLFLAATLANLPAMSGVTATQNDQGQSSRTATMPVSLQQKMQRLHEVIERRQEEGSGASSVAELVHSLRSLIQQHKFAEAEALVDRILTLLGEKREPKETGEASLLAFATRGAGGSDQIVLSKPDGSGEIALNQTGKHNFAPAWSPDGKRIAYTSVVGGTPQIWTMDANGGHPEQLTSPGANLNPAWSPDGAKLAFASARTGRLEIWVMETDGSNQIQLTDTPAVPASKRIAQSVAMEIRRFGIDMAAAGGISNNFPTWSPDGRHLAFCSTRSGSYSVWTMDAEGHHLAQITGRYGDDYPDSQSPAWSPDGASIAFSAGDASKGTGNIWVINADGTNPTRLTNFPPEVKSYAPAWSADGEQIIFSTVRAGYAAIFVIDADGQNGKTLISGVDVAPGRISWQPMGINQ